MSITDSTYSPLVPTDENGSSTFDWRGRLGWLLTDAAAAMQRFSHRLTRGETPTLETTTVDHLHQMSVMSGIPAWALVSGPEIGPTSKRIASRVYCELVRQPVSAARLEAVADALGVDVLDLVLTGSSK